MINIDIKIALKALAFRLREVIHKVIHYDKTAYVEGRCIGEPVRLIDDLLVYAESQNLDAILFASDIEKAIDSVEHNFIFASLKKFCFGKGFIRWIKTFMNDFQNCVMINGTSTAYSTLSLNVELDRETYYLHICSL